VGSRSAPPKSRTAPGRRARIGRPTGPDRRTRPDRSAGPGRRKAFAAKVYAIVQAIPAGRVMTYGGIAAFIPPPAGISWTGYARVRARWVGYAMAACPDNLPWQRVVNAQGRISPRPGLSAGVQRALLRQERVRFNRSGRLDLRLLEWKPSESWLRARGLLRLARASRGQGVGRVP